MSLRHWHTTIYLDDACEHAGESYSPAKCPQCVLQSARAEIAELRSDIERATANNAEMATEIEQLRKEIRALEEKRVELNAVIGERDAEIERQRKGLSPPHRCEKIASAIMDDGRDWWVGRLLEPVVEHPQETHCLHLRTPIKDVVFLVNDADFQWLTVLGRAACGAINETWLERVADGAKKRAETIKDTTDG